MTGPAKPRTIHLWLDSIDAAAQALLPEPEWHDGLSRLLDQAFPQPKMETVLVTDSIEGWQTTVRRYQGLAERLSVTVSEEVMEALRAEAAKPTLLRLDLPAYDALTPRVPVYSGGWNHDGRRPDYVFTTLGTHSPSWADPIVDQPEPDLLAEQRAAGAPPVDMERQNAEARERRGRMIPCSVLPILDERTTEDQRRARVAAGRAMSDEEWSASTRAIIERARAGLGSRVIDPTSVIRYTDSMTNHLTGETVYSGLTEEQGARPVGDYFRDPDGSTYHRLLPGTWGYEYGPEFKMADRPGSAAYAEQEQQRADAVDAALTRWERTGRIILAGTAAVALVALVAWRRAR